MFYAGCGDGGKLLLQLYFFQLFLLLILFLSSAYDNAGKLLASFYSISVKFLVVSCYSSSSLFYYGNAGMFYFLLLSLAFLQLFVFNAISVY